ncbi:MAG: BON domain-containing protein [Rhodoferax sp.]|jgi:osmotically-inducible protein OsmY|nr:BON domain-containing protein [Rhodoferax sp.]
MTQQSDDDVKSNLMEILDCIPAVNANDIDVQVSGGMVTLTGKVDTHQTRFHIERLARRVRGVRGLQINIRPSAMLLNGKPHKSGKI